MTCSMKYGWWLTIKSCREPDFSQVRKLWSMIYMSKIVFVILCDKQISLYLLFHFTSNYRNSGRPENKNDFQLKNAEIKESPSKLHDTRPKMYFEFPHPPHSANGNEFLAISWNNKKRLSENLFDLHHAFLNRDTCMCQERTEIDIK